MTSSHTTQADIKSEIERQSARLAFTVDPTHKRILTASLADLLALYKVYPETVWAAAPKVAE